MLLLLALVQDGTADALRARGIEPDAAGVVRYLSRLAPTDENRERAVGLVRRLGDEDFRAREEAYEQLRLLLPALRALAADAIDGALKSNDLEVQSRARRLLRESTTAEARFVFRAALVQAGRLKAKGAAAAVLPLHDIVEDPFVRRSMVVAVRDAADKDDVPRLRAAGSPPAVAALGRLGEDVAPYLQSGDETIRLAAARALVDRGDRAGLAPLGELLSSKDEMIARDAASALRLATGVFHDTPEKWTKWIRDEGATAKLTFPLPDRPPELGRTLICIYGQNKVIELDSAGKEIFEANGMAHPWGCFGLPNGHRLVAAYSNQKVVEYDETGKEVWSKDGLPGGPMSVQRLENGNTLIACSDSHKVLEVARDGSIVREETIEGRTSDADELDNGNWLVTLQNGNKVVEVNRAGETVWTLDGLSSPLTAQRLENGHTLVAEMGVGRVAEYDRSGNRVWFKDGLSSPYDAQRLENGNTLVVDGSGVTEFDPTGKEIWKHAQGSVSRIRRY